MRTDKAFSALCSVLFAGSLAFVPALTSQASAAPKPAQATAEHSVVTDPFRDGYRSGFRNGYSDAKDDCRRSGMYGYGSRSRSDSRWARGYSQGYSQGYASAENRYC